MGEGKTEGDSRGGENIQMRRKMHKKLHLENVWVFGECGETRTDGPSLKPLWYEYFTIAEHLV